MDRVRAITEALLHQGELIDGTEGCPQTRVGTRGCYCRRDNLNGPQEIAAAAFSPDHASDGESGCDRLRNCRRELSPAFR